MKKSHSLMWLLQLVVTCVFAQKSIESSDVKSKFSNEDGIAQFVSFNEVSKLQSENRSNLLKEFFEAPENTSFVKVDAKTDRIGMLHETFQQYYNNIPVEFGIYKAHLKNGGLSAINGDYFPIKEINTTPNISENDAVLIAKSHVKVENNYDQSADNINDNGLKPTLVIFPKMKNINAVDRLVYKLDINVDKPLYHADVYIDAHTGEIIFEHSKIHQNNVPANGTTLYNGVQNFTAEEFRIGYRLRQTTHGNGIQTFNATNGVQNATDIISASDNFNTINTAAVQLHWGTEQVHEYFLQEHNRNSFDGNGALIKSYLIPQSAVPNAYWTGDVLFYSMGNGSNVGALTSMDIIGHEFAHAVGDHTAGLIYSNQSGAIDESFSDIFGEMVEHHALGSNDWLCGAEVFSGGIRSLSDPKSKQQPDTYLGQYWQTTSNDNFGVHTNSGVHNKWFYLLAAGGSGTNDNGLNYNVSGIGIQKAAEIAYRSLSLYLTPTANYHYACEVSIYAAIQLFGPNSPEAIATAQAWHAVGLLTQQTDYITPTTPLNLFASNATLSNVDLSWDASTDNVGVTGYTVLLDGAAVATTPSTSHTVTGLSLQHNITYEFTVVAFDAAGNVSAPSNIEFVWFDTLPPNIPTNLISSNTTQTTTDLNWDYATDNYPWVEYQIYQNPGNLHVATVTGTAYTVTGLTENSNYSFYVRAVDAAGNASSPSNTVNVTTLMSSCLGGNGNLSLTINVTDTYFNFALGSGISWSITDAANVIVASGSNYPDSPTSYTVVENITLAPGLYTFDITDSYGWENGFVLESNQVIASESDISFFLPTSFCVDTSVNRASSTLTKLPNSNTKQSGMIYPNPVSNKLNYRSLDNENKTFLILDLTGKVVINGELDSENSIDVSDLRSGLYILRIIDEEDTEYHKFIKK